MLIWVFGGTAVGKKHFINKVLELDAFEDFAAAWMKDGDDVDNEVDVSRDLLLRWQWGREHTLHTIKLVSPAAKQTIVLVKANLECHYDRALQREQKEKFNADALLKEALG